MTTRPKKPVVQPPSGAPDETEIRESRPVDDKKIMKHVESRLVIAKSVIDDIKNKYQIGGSK